jgi:hypothetical protein
MQFPRFETLSATKNTNVTFFSGRRKYILRLTNTNKITMRLTQLVNVSHEISEKNVYSDFWNLFLMMLMEGCCQNFLEVRISKMIVLR